MAELWWRSWHGAPMDHKWSVIAARTGVKAGIVSAVAWALLDYASQNEDRGSVNGFDIETYSVFSGFSEEDISSVIHAMTDKGIIVDGRLANWEKRQPKSESEIERNREYRKRKESVSKRSNIERELVATNCYEMLQDATEKCIDTDTDKDKELINCKIEKPILRVEVVKENNNSPKKPKESKPKLKPNDPDFWKFLKENELYGLNFYEATKLFPVGDQFGLWVEGCRELREAGITPEVIPKAVSLARSRKWPIKSPKSILTAAREIKMNQETVSSELDGWLLR